MVTVLSKEEASQIPSSIERDKRHFKRVGMVENERSALKRKKQMRKTCGRETKLNVKVILGQEKLNNFRPVSV